MSKEVHEGMAIEQIKKENIDALHNVKFRYHSLAMTRLKTITEITKKYKKWENGGLPDGMSIEMLHNELIRLHDIASGQHYFDYEKQKKVDIKDVKVAAETDNVDVALDSLDFDD